MLIVLLHLSTLSVYIINFDSEQEMSQSRDECPQRNWSSIRQI